MHDGRANIFFRHMLRRLSIRGFPQGWETCLLDRVAERCTGHTPTRDVANYWNGDVKWVSLADCERLDKVFIEDTSYRISEDGIANSSAVKHPKGTVILSRDAGVGKSAITANDMAVSQHFVAWKCSQELNNLFLYYWLQFLKREFERVAVGSTIKTIGMPYFAKLGVILPPQEEQEAIAKCLYAWDAGASKLADLIEAKQARKRALMQQLLTGKRRFPEFGEPWVEMPLGGFLTESRVPGNHGAAAKKLSVKLYGRGVCPKVETRPGSKKTQYYRRAGGQLIYSKLDFLNGAFGIIPDELDGYESTLDLPAFDIADALSTRWLIHLLTNPTFYERQVGLARGGRKARRVNPRDFLRIRLAMPTLPEQRKIAAVLDAADDEIALLREELELLKKQKRGLMQKLLTGQVRVKGA